MVSHDTILSKHCIQERRGYCPPKPLRQVLITSLGFNSGLNSAEIWQDFIYVLQYAEDIRTGFNGILKTDIDTMPASHFHDLQFIIVYRTDP